MNASSRMMTLNSGAFDGKFWRTYCNIHVYLIKIIRYIQNFILCKTCLLWALMEFDWILPFRHAYDQTRGWGSQKARRIQECPNRRNHSVRSILYMSCGISKRIGRPCRGADGSSVAEDIAPSSSSVSSAFIAAPRSRPTPQVG